MRASAPLPQARRGPAAFAERLRDAEVYSKCSVGLVFHKQNHTVGRRLRANNAHVLWRLRANNVDLPVDSVDWD